MVTLRDVSLFLKANSCFQLKENGNSLGFNLVADIVAVVNWNTEYSGHFKRYQSVSKS